MVDIKIIMNKISFIIPILLACLSGGCASWEKHGVVADENAKFRIALMPITITAEVSQLSDIVTVENESVSESEQIQAQMRIVTQQLNAMLKDTLAQSSVIELVPIESIQSIKSSDLAAFQASPDTMHLLSDDTLQKMRADYNVQAVLLVNVSGYGKIKKKWLMYLIGSGIVEGIVQGYVAARLVDNTWVGVAIGLEEIAQEVLLWGGGSRLFNKYYSPVTLEANLISTRDAQEVWDDIIFTSVDDDALQLLPEDERNKREVQLMLTAKKAIKELIGELNDTAISNTTHESKIPDGDDMMFD